jgi:hypothetical protein
MNRGHRGGERAAPTLERRRILACRPTLMRWSTPDPAETPDPPRAAAGQGSITSAILTVTALTAPMIRCDEAARLFLGVGAAAACSGGALRRAGQATGTMCRARSRTASWRGRGSTWKVAWSRREANSKLPIRHRPVVVTAHPARQERRVWLRSRRVGRDRYLFDHQRRSTFLVEEGR